MSLKRWVFMAWIAALGASVGSAAAEAADTFQGQALDENGDGAVTTEEFEGYVLARWAVDDLNDDGQSRRASGRPSASCAALQHFQHTDWNRDGIVERSEADSYPTRCSRSWTPTTTRNAQSVRVRRRDGAGPDGKSGGRGSPPARRRRSRTA